MREVRVGQLTGVTRERLAQRSHETASGLIKDVPSLSSAEHFEHYVLKRNLKWHRLVAFSIS